MHAVEPTLFEFLSDTSSSSLIIAILINLGAKVAANETILKREFNEKGKHIVIPPNVKDKKYVLSDEIIKERYGEKILHFKQVLEGELKPKNLTLFYSNIESLEINYDYKNKKSRWGTVTLGEYDMGKNSINIYQDNEFNLYHELIHMSSRLNSSFIGFYQSQTQIGKGINEGYTQLLCERYFNEQDESYKIYGIEKHIASNLEKIVGKEKMEDLYFSANLYGLYKEIEKYASKEDILKFFHSLDLVNSFARKSMLSITKEARLDKCIKYIYLLLAKMWIKKCQMNYEMGSMTPFDYLVEIDIYLSELNVLAFNKYRTFNTKTLKELYNECTIPTNHVLKF